MREIELTVGQSVQVGGHILRVLAVYPDEVVLDLLGPDEDTEPPTGYESGLERTASMLCDKV